jgi:hypothetical protein
LLTLALNHDPLKFTFLGIRRARFDFWSSAQPAAPPAVSPSPLQAAWLLQAQWHLPHVVLSVWLATIHLSASHRLGLPTSRSPRKWHIQVSEPHRSECDPSALGLANHPGQGLHQYTASSGRNWSRNGIPLPS